MKNAYIHFNLYFVKIDTSSPYKGEDKFLLMYGSGGANLGCILSKTEMLEKYPNGEWFDRFIPSNFN